MSESNLNKTKIGKVLAGIFAAIGFYVVFSLAFQMIFRASMSENECQVHASSTFPSPDNEYTAELTYMSCGSVKAISEVSLRRKGNESEAAVLLSVKRNIDKRGPAPYPPGISLSWDSPAHLVITAPHEEVRARKSEESYDATVTYVPST